MKPIDTAEGGTVHRYRTRRHAGRSFDAHAHPSAVPVADGIFRIAPARKGQALEGTLLIQDEVTVLFDTGLAYDQALELSEVVDLVVNTHAHLGHTGKNYLFTEVWAYEGEAEFVEDFERAVGFHGFAGSPIEAQWRSAITRERAGPMAKVGLRFRDGDVLDFGRTRWQVVLTPGHSPGHCSFYERELGVLYAGDITLNSFGPWYATPGSDIRAFRRSIRKLMALEPRVVATSAKGPIDEAIAERFLEFDAHFERRDQAMLAFLHEPRSIPEIVAKLFIYRSFGARTESGPMLEHNERMMVEKHLDLLMTAGRVAAKDGKYWATN